MAITDKQIDRVVRSGFISRTRTRLGGSHTVVTYPPLDALEPLTSTDPVQLTPHAALNLYFHIPFCEFICGFCHYAKTFSGVNETDDQVTAYLEALQQEIDWRFTDLKGSHVQSIYIGGGTPTVLPRAHMLSLVEKIRSVAGQPESFCVETSPLSAGAADGREKLAALTEAGVNRFSIGVQTFDDVLLRSSRGHSQAELLHGLEALLAQQVDINIDMIQDLPNQTRASVDADLDWLAQLRPGQVTWYLMRLQSGSSWHKAQRKTLANVQVDDAESIALRLHIVERMQALGYHVEPGGRFLRDTGDGDVYKQVRGGVDSHLLGFGLSAYSHGWGWFFRNMTDSKIRNSIGQYVKCMHRGQSPVAWTRFLDEDEILAGRMIAGLRTELDPALVATADPGYVDILERLRLLELVERTAAGAWHLTALGYGLEEEILSLFYSERVKEALAAKGLYWVAAA